MRIGTGPVFAYEWLIGSRRWQMYALRSAFVLVLLVGMIIVALSNDFRYSGVSIRALATVGTKFSETLVGLQLALVLLVAPAATAGAICVDKARGTLTHLLVTDLSDAEIVLGKLAARLVPVLGLVCCTAPVMLIATLLGGADPAGLVGAFLTSIGLACFGCSLAFALSVWGRKTHEVLLAAYLFITIWLLAGPGLSTAIAVSGGTTSVPEWFGKLNPYLLCYGNVMRPGSVGVWDYAVFFVTFVLLAVALATLSVVRIRAVTIRHQSGPLRKRLLSRQIPFSGLAKLWSALPGPSLDGNPVLWREWHRNRPSRWSQICWVVYVLIAGGFSAYLIFEGIAGAGSGGRVDALAAFTNGFQVATALLLLSVSAASALAEERLRGSLDVLLATPLSTSSIVWGKWWGAFRTVPLLCLLPCVVLASLSIGKWDVMSPLVLGVNIVAMGAAITSLGLALATWVKRLGRAITISVVVNVLLTAGWFFLILAVSSFHTTGEHMAMASPFFGPGNITFHGAAHQSGSRAGVLVAGFAWSIVFALGSAGFLALTLLTFDRCLGRMSASQPRVSAARKLVLDPELVFE
jgi:ABC-type transport system involved in multi-copper enzyme maturation permease subunit